MCPKKNYGFLLSIFDICTPTEKGVDVYLVIIMHPLICWIDL